MAAVGLERINAQLTATDGQIEQQEKRILADDENLKKSSISPAERLRLLQPLREEKNKLLDEQSRLHKILDQRLCLFVSIRCFCRMARSCCVLCFLFCPLPAFWYVCSSGLILKVEYDRTNAAGVMRMEVDSETKIAGANFDSSLPLVALVT